MSMSLRDQLLQAGLVSDKQAREAERKQQQPHRQQVPKNKRGAPSEQQRAAQQAQSAKAAHDQELNRKRQEKLERKARQAQINQLIEQNRLPKIQSEERFSFIDGRKIRRITTDNATRERLDRGEIAIVRYQAGYEFVPALIAERIRERDPHVVIATGTAGLDATGAGAAPGDDAYQDFPVPDDLRW